MPTIFEYQYINYKASIIGILIMLALNNINYKASIGSFFCKFSLDVDLTASDDHRHYFKVLP